MGYSCAAIDYYNGTVDGKCDYNGVDLETSWGCNCDGCGCDTDSVAPTPEPTTEVLTIMRGQSKTTTTINHIPHCFRHRHQRRHCCHHSVAVTTTAAATGHSCPITARPRVMRALPNHTHTPVRHVLRPLSLVRARYHTLPATSPCSFLTLHQCENVVGCYDQSCDDWVEDHTGDDNYFSSSQCSHMQDSWSCDCTGCRCMLDTPYPTTSVAPTPVSPSPTEVRPSPGPTTTPAPTMAVESVEFNGDTLVVSKTTIINYDNNELTGTIPTEFGLLTGVTWLECGESSH